MAKTIKAILNKKNLTGKEVGRALLLSLKHEIENYGKPHSPLFTQAEYDRMCDCLTTPRQRQDYFTLEAIYTAIRESFNRKETMIQQFYNGYYRYYLSIRETQRAENFYDTLERFPLILSRSQYENLYKEAETYKRNFTESFYSLFFSTLEDFISAVEREEDSVPEDIKALILETKSQKVTNKRIIANWAEDCEEGYYTLPDGRRSDNMSLEEWQAALEEEYMKTHELTIDGEPASPKQTAFHYNSERLFAYYKLLFEGEDELRDRYRERTGKEATDKDLEELEKEIEDAIDGVAPTKRNINKAPSPFTSYFAYDGDNITEWHFYESLPEDFTKYDVLANMLDRYRGNYTDRLLESGGEYVPEISEREQFKEFKKDYPALYEAVKTYIEGAIPSLKGLKANQLYNQRITWGELADLDYMDYKALIKPDNRDLTDQIAETQGETLETVNKRRRGNFHGIAIVEEALYFDRADNGDYIDPVSDDFQPETIQSIDYLEENPDEAEGISEYLDILALPALRYMYAYNAMIEVFADVYNIEFLGVAKYDLSRQESQIDACNNLLYMLYKNVYGTDEDKKRKRAFIKKYYKPVDLEELKPRQEKIDALKERLEGLGYTREAEKTIKNYDSLVMSIIREGYFGE